MGLRAKWASKPVKEYTIKTVFWGLKGTCGMARKNAQGNFNRLFNMEDLLWRCNWGKSRTRIQKPQNAYQSVILPMFGDFCSDSFILISVHVAARLSCVSLLARAGVSGTARACAITNTTSMLLGIVNAYAYLQAARESQRERDSLRGREGEATKREDVRGEETQAQSEIHRCVYIYTYFCVYMYTSMRARESWRS